MAESPLLARLLRGEQRLATAMTWVPGHALRALTWESGFESEPESLEAVARAFSLDLVFVPAREAWAPEAVARLVDADIVAGWIVDGVLTRVAAERGWSEVLAESAARPGELAYAFDEALHECLDEARDGLASGARALLCADELAGAAGWLVSPDFALDALLPCYRRIAAEWVESMAVFHSDGDIRALMPALAEAGFGGIHLSPGGTASVSALVEAARAVGLCPLGGIGTQAMFAEGARAQGTRVAELAQSGVLIAADDGGLSRGEEVAAFGAALSAARSILEQAQG